MWTGQSHAEKPPKHGKSLKSNKCEHSRLLLIPNDADSGIRQIRFASIARRHDFDLEDGKKVIGGSLLNKNLLKTLNVEASGASAPKGDTKKEAKTPKTPRKRKDGDAKQEPPAPKKTKTTETQQTEQTIAASALAYVAAQEADQEQENGASGSMA